MRIVKMIYVSLPLLGSVAAAEARDQPLADTLEWIDNTYNSHEKTGGAWGHGREEWSNNGKVFRRRTESISINRCKWTLTLSDDPGVATSMAMTSITTVDLSDVDPHSLEVTTYDSQRGGLSCKSVPNLTCNMARIDFETRSQIPAMMNRSRAVFPQLKGKDHTSAGQNKTFVATIVLDDLAYATRFERAFRHAINLCGGKASPF